jgi:hypothetical protein
VRTILKCIERERERERNARIQNDKKQGLLAKEASNA